ncbi:lysylphosphatidylglycerol synthase transmembrane domain-containing protein [Candidatus Leptofilum sp.]|uniref:lysylphosphatidylglycerol synthase transmembrane domain-containing protein n=1 Tax=Candidatus Leptofilum sp. TaxID=3241576 RepID=UPI003B597835
MESSGQNRRQLWIGIAVSALSIALILLLIDPAEIVDSLRQAEVSLIGWSALAILAFMLIRAIRWRYMLANEISWSQTFHIQNIGYMFNMVLPFRLGDVARAVLIGNVPPITLARGLSTMVVERILDMMFIVALLPFTLAEVASLPPWMQDGARASGIVAVIAIGALIVAANQRKLATRWGTAVLNRIPFLNTEQWIGRMNELLDGLGSLTRLKDSVALVFFSIAVWIPILFAYRWGILAVGGNVSLLGASFVVCAAALSIALPSSPGQIGVFHIGVTAAMLALGQSDGAAGGFAVVYHALNLISMVILGLIGLASTGATFGSVIETTQRFMRRRQTVEDGDLSKIES